LLYHLGPRFGVHFCTQRANNRRENIARLHRGFPGSPARGNTTARARTMAALL
jgi:hypothetical protein